MITSPGSLTVTDTDVTAHDVHRLDPTAHAALCEWLQFHDIDPMQVPASTTITRDVTGCRVLYERIERDAQGNLVAGVDGHPVIVDAYSQGEAPPLPWPAAVLAHKAGDA